jgi:hypothetical protein
MMKSPQPPSMILARRVRFAAPFPFADQVIIAVRLPGSDSAPLFARNSQESLHHREDFLRILVPAVLEPGVKIVEVTSVEKNRRLFRSYGRISGECEPGNQDAGRQTKRN